MSKETVTENGASSVPLDKIVMCHTDGWKCDSCVNSTGYVLGADECGTGNFLAYCAKGHWDGFGPDSAEEEERQKKHARSLDRLQRLFSHITPF